MPAGPLVSVIIPTYNCASHIARAVQSVARQSYRNLEIVIIDDGSQDDTREVIEGLGIGNIRYIHQHNRGVAQARNRGILAARGTYVAYVDADDELDERMVEECLTALVRDNAEWCITDITKVRSADGTRTGVVAKSPVPPEDRIHAILHDDFVLRAPFFRRDTLIDIGLYDARLLTREDWDMSIRLIHAGRKFSYVAKPLYAYYCRNDSLMRKSKRLSYECTLTVLRKHHRRLADEGDRQAGRIYAENIWWLGRNFLKNEHDIVRFAYCVAESMRYHFDGKRYLAPLVHLMRRISPVHRHD